MATLGQALEGQQRRLFTGRERELAAFREWLQAEPAQPELLLVSGPGGIGKSSLLQAFGDEARQAGRSVLWADCRDFGGSQAGLLSYFGGGSLAEVVSTINAGLPLVLLDTFEDLGDLAPVVQRELLPQLNVGVKLVIAGRQPPLTWSQQGAWSQMIRPLTLSGFSADEARTYLERRGVCDGAVLDQAIRTGHGHPLALSLIGDMVMQLGLAEFKDAEDWHLVVRALAERLVADLKDPALRNLLDCCAVVRQFDEPTLAALAAGLSPAAESPPRAIAEAFQQLCRLSFVRPVRHGLAVHEDVRQILADDLRWRHPQRYAELRSRAMDYYQERARAASKADQHWLLTERLFLLEHPLIQQNLFSGEAPREVSLEPGQPGDHAEIREVWREYWDEAIMPSLDPGLLARGRELATCTFLDAVLAYAGTRLRVARGRNGRILGFSTVVPLCSESVPLLERHVGAAAMLHAYGALPGAEPLAPAAAGSRVLQVVHIVYLPDGLHSAGPALSQDIFGLWSIASTVLSLPVSIPPCGEGLATFYNLSDALGAEVVPGAVDLTWGDDYPIQGCMLDLTSISPETWMDAISQGRRPQRSLTAAELEHALQDALSHWNEDPRLASSDLFRLLPAPPGRLQAVRAEELRKAILNALERGRLKADPQRRLEYLALEYAYIQRAASYERAAERLAVSRSTFYRLLKRGLDGLARELLSAA